MNSRVDIILGLECNQNCTFCFNKPIKHKYGNSDFTLGKIKQTLQKGKDSGLKAVSISGGEPTISPNFFKALDECKALGYKEIRIISNGMMFSYEDFTKKLAKYRISQICISMHSDNREGSKVITGVPDSFDKTLRGIRNLKKHVGCSLTAHVVLSKETSGKLIQHTRFLMENGFTAINFLYLMPNCGENWEQIPDRGTVIRNLRETLSEFKDKIYIHIGYLEPCAMPEYEEHFDTNDFDMEFISNVPQLFDDWKDTLIRNKVQEKECRTCKHLKTCLGFWRHNKRS